MKPTCAAVLLCLTITLGCRSSNHDVLLYGIWKRTDGVAVIQLHRGNVNQIVKANALRPRGVSQDWTRMLVDLRPIAANEEFLIYYLDRSTDSREQFVKTGVYRKQLNSDEVAQLLVETDRLSSIDRNVSSGEILATTESATVLLINPLRSSLRVLDVPACRFASWASAQHAIVLLTLDGQEIQTIDVDSGVVQQRVGLPQGECTRAFLTQEPGTYLLQQGWDVILYREASGKATLMGPSSTRTCVTFARAHGLAYCLIPDDKDGRTLEAISLHSGRVQKLIYGVFADRIAVN